MCCNQDLSQSPLPRLPFQSPQSQEEPSSLYVNDLFTHSLEAGSLDPHQNGADRPQNFLNCDRNLENGNLDLTPPREKSSKETVVAVKVLKEKAGVVGAGLREDFMREVEMMASFSHPNILRLLGIVLQGEDFVKYMLIKIQ